MPTWLIPIIKLAISIGSPYLLELIGKWIGKLSPEIQIIIKELIDGLLNPSVSNKEARSAAHTKLKACTGVGCPPETK